MPAHHVADELLCEYAAGTTAEAVSLAVACHLTLCAECQGRLRAFEAVGGALLDSGPIADIDTESLAQTMARLGQVAPPPATVPDPRPREALGLPAPLAVYLTPGQDVPWKFLAPGVRGIELTVSQPARAPQTRARLVRLRAGMTIPWHDHQGPEYTVIFAGGLTDGGEHFGRGDLAMRNEGEQHDQVIDRGDDCVALVINEGPLIPLTLVGRILKLFLPE